MLQTLARKPRVIAWFLTTLFYLQLVLLPLVTRANTRPLPARLTTYADNSWKTNSATREPLIKNESYKTPEKITGKTKVEKIDSSGHVQGTVTTGPTQPETQSFQSVNANNLVDLFTGDFSYNIPLLDVGGYPVNLHYQSGITMDQEASWVGLGWNISPGQVTRNMRGLPDDFQGEQDKVIKTISIKPNKTFGVTVGANAELFGFSKILDIGNGDSVKGRSGVAGISLGIFHNTYKGWGTEVGLNANINAGSAAKGSLSAGLSITNNSQDGFDFSPSIGVKIAKEGEKAKGNISIGTNYNSRVGIQNLQICGEIRQSNNDYKKRWTGGLSHGFSIGFAKPSYTPTINIPYTNSQFSLTAKVGFEQWAFHPNFYVRGYSSVQAVEENDKKLSLPAYGYLYYEKAGNNRNVLLDFNREKDVPFSDNSPHIAVPIYTYDTWSISGEGTGGMFRAYRGDVGYVFDHSMTTRSNSNKFSLDVGFGNIFHGGVDFNRVDAFSKNNPWEADNNFNAVSSFKQTDTTFESAYFKNPGEKTSANKTYLHAIGNDSLIRVDLSPAQDKNPSVVMATQQVSLFQGGKTVASRIFDANVFRKTRDKRTQVISYLNAQEARVVGLDTIIRSYNINAFPATTCNNNYEPIARIDPVRKEHHVSEITVLNPDGRRYVYGIPVYNIRQTEVTMSTQQGNNATGLVSYDSTDNSTKNSQGKDGYYNKEELPSYSHSFLLSGILSTDYVDITGDGITEDDNGDGVKFNYSRVYNSNTPYKWRAPYQQDQASYNEGLKTDNRDERGSFTYGEREVWYLNSVESKTMIATFVLETDSIRQDSYGVKGENGGQEITQKLYQLKQINLYTKADYLKNGQANAKPIKSVHFEYSYELCKKNPGSLSNTGKLTLKKVWFSYNKNNKGKRNPYVFTYNAANPDFSHKSVDRWGNYKNPKDNPGSSGQELTNADYPYTLQVGVKDWDTTKATDSVAPWTLSQVKLPSGAQLKVSYESDDYAYVQNRRAMQFFSIAGFGNKPDTTITAKLYFDNRANQDFHYVFINVTEAVNSKVEIMRKYLDGVTQLFFKLAVNVPGDKWGKGFEIIPVYAEIEDVGIREGGDNKTIWIKVKPIKGNESPFVTTALQFLRLNLPSKAYPFSEPGDNLDIRTLVGTLASAADNVKNVINTFSSEARHKNLCNSVVTNKSFVRLNNPVYKKMGGGLRVKKVEVYDNWNKMTGQQESVYGQTYTYTDTIMIQGVKTGISSGVATYEPAIGNDENPFRVPQKLYTVKVGALVPADYMYTEEPFAETFFPSPMIGYSKVRIQSIHKDKKSANGFEETEFYTSKDFPVIIEYTPIDDKSKKTYNPKIRNFLNFDARHYVTLSQGFKIELNDMNGKLKSQVSYSQNDLKNPISYTYNYYRLKNDNAAQPRLSNTVAVVDSACGRIDTAEMGKEVELMIDVREETSYTISKSLEVNADFVHPFPPISIFTGIPLPSMETNRYRSIAVLKIVNCYGLLDSIIHIEKGSRVTTRNLLYDGETGDVLLSQTNNEFDDPVYNFSYPAHWAYTGMGPAYRNIGTVLNNVTFRKGIMFDGSGTQRIPVERYFESGDELLVNARDIRMPYTYDYCTADYYQFEPTYNRKKIWAVDASKGKDGQQGIYFIDKDGQPYSGDGDIKIVRSGKRNMPGIPVGTITSLHSPIKEVDDIPRIIFDSTTRVIAASAGRFKDVWKVDSTTYAKDTLIYVAHKMDTAVVDLNPVDNFTIHRIPLSSFGGSRYEALPDNNLFEASSYFGGGPYLFEEKKSWLKFDFTSIPKGAVVKSAWLNLYGCNNTLHSNMRYSNACYLERSIGLWPGLFVPQNPNYEDFLIDYFNGTGYGLVDESTRVTLDETTYGTTAFRDEEVDITGMAQGMLDGYYNSFKIFEPAMRIDLVDPDGLNNGNISRLAYNTKISPNECVYGQKLSCEPRLRLTYYLPCQDDSQPNYSSTPTPGYYCTDYPVDSFVCKNNINDTAVNYYRFGILGNWRMDRAYTYYGSRGQSDPSATTNIRTQGEIKDFAPYWAFTNSLLAASTDTARWVWSSEMTLFNSKGYEIENHDPLNRYNAGQYGYNQTLPVAVAQNAKSREIAFEGFEDYGYRTDTCKRCAVNRHIDLGSGNTLVDTSSHSGLYSLRVGGNQTVSKAFSIGSVQDTAGPLLSMKEDSIAKVHTTVNGNGAGLTIESDCVSGVETSNINYQSNTNPIPGLCRSTLFSIVWKGFIQPRYTGAYRLWGTADDFMSVHIERNGVDIDLTGNTPLEGPHDWPIAYPTDTIVLNAGELYPITVIFDQFFGPYQVKLEWESLGLQPQSREVVPKSQLYPTGTNITTTKSNTTVNDTTWCTRFKDPTVTQAVIKRFSPLAGKKVVVSAWVKQETACISGNYDSAKIELSFNDPDTTTIQLTPSGNIVEGWQLIDDTLTIPAAATACTFSMKSTSAAPVFFDDVRIQPFNANLKTFVYNPVNLRLMAELDENNYATFYEYDDDGTLIRVKKETERGIKTIKETRSALIKE